MSDLMQKQAPQDRRADETVPESDDPLSRKRGKTARDKRSLFRGLFDFLSGGRDDEDEEAEQQRHAMAEWTPQEKLMLANIAELHEARAEDVMIPRAEIEALDLEETLAETLRRFEQTGHSRMPVYSETLDDPRGMIHIRDLLNYVTRATLGKSAEEKAAGNASEKKDADAFAQLDLSMPIAKLGIVRDVLFVPASMPAGRLLARMQAGHIQMALVIDEHGGTDGLVSMEDIVELIVGDIEDEHDDDDDDIVSDAPNSWVLDAGTELEELKEHLGIDFSDNEQTREVDTIGGLIVTALDRIPARGEKVKIIPHYLFQILDADRRRIKRIRLTKTD